MLWNHGPSSLTRRSISARDIRAVVFASGIGMGAPSGLRGSSSAGVPELTGESFESLGAMRRGVLGQDARARALGDALTLFVADALQDGERVLGTGRDQDLSPRREHGVE